MICTTVASRRFDQIGNRVSRWPFQRARNWQAKNLVFWWSGAPRGYDTAYDFGPNGQHLFVGAQLRDDWIATEFGGWAIDFAGTSDWIETNDFSWSGGPITICFWTKIASATEASAFGFDATLGADRVQAHVPWSDGVLYWDYGDTTNGRVSWDMSSLIGQWIHIVLVATGSSGSFQGIYVNGVLRASAGNSDEATGSKLEIGHGGFSGADYYHNGPVFDFRVYDRTLNAAEIWVLFAPQTRWSLYKQLLSLRAWFVATGATVIPIDAATISVAGSAVKANELIAIARATVSYIGRNVDVNASTIIQIANATVSYVGQSLSVNARETIQIAAATISYIGQAITIVEGQFVVITNAAVSYVGRAVNVNAAEIVQIASATISCVGRNLSVIAGGVVVRTRELWHRSSRKGHWW